MNHLSSVFYDIQYCFYYKYYYNFIQLFVIQEIRDEQNILFPWRKNTVKYIYIYIIFNRYYYIAI